MYNFVSGPLVTIAFAVFIGGLIYTFVTTYKLAKKERVVLPTFSAKYGLRSLLHWGIPFRNRNTQLRPIFTIISFTFHITLLATPIFLFAHNMLLEKAFGFSLPALPEILTDLMTVVVILAVGFFFIRRLVVPVVRYVSDAKDYLMLLIVVAPFVTGFLAYHQLLPSEQIQTLHIISGALWLMVIPFTRIVHMLWWPFTRAYMGSESGAVRHSRDW
jgi:nitrate reductase gamma subunit